MKAIIKSILTFIFAEKCDVCGVKTLNLHVSWLDYNKDVCEKCI